MAEVENAPDSPHDPPAAQNGRDKGKSMKVHAPSEAIYWTSISLLGLALVGHFMPDAAFLTQYQFWIAIASSVVMILGCVV
jgi:hypothetical protein